MFLVDDTKKKFFFADSYPYDESRPAVDPNHPLCMSYTSSSLSVPKVLVHVTWTGLIPVGSSHHPEIFLDDTFNPPSFTVVPASCGMKAINRLDYLHFFSCISHTAACSF